MEVRRLGERATAALVGQWTFENDSLADATGHFPDLTLVNGASVAGGRLSVTAGQYAESPAGYSGAAITAKTLVAWAYLRDMSTTGGALLSLTNGAGDPNFDGIVFAERTSRQWMAGSEYWHRSPVDNAGAAETASSSHLLQLAIVYKTSPDTIEIYRDGNLYTTCACSTVPTYSGTATNVFLGARLRYMGSVYGWVNAQIAEARLYDAPLTQQEIRDLAIVPEPTALSLLALGAAGTLAQGRRSGRLRHANSGNAPRLHSRSANHGV